MKLTVHFGPKLRFEYQPDTPEQAEEIVLAFQRGGVIDMRCHKDRSRKLVRMASAVCLEIVS